MAKSKNHTNKNQNRKDHRNGIKRPRRYRQRSWKGVCPKFLKNLRFVRKGLRQKALRDKMDKRMAEKSQKIAEKTADNI
ncbi:hypothetical protein M514_26007 [Trichuris suis]|uniref:60S ribosomal protein L29 n=1 Tax=Trichuris suis TaxID=68888 RepID=A0A085MX59_9BILA|nr:hypothetical protein M514_26007 [Trichuris suis]KHJ40271.1 ribosomal L29e protein [Trichuris suis]